jgi:hypothetical protein
VLVGMMGIGHVGVSVAGGLMPVWMTVGPVGHHIVMMIVMAVVVPVCMLMLERVVLVLMSVRLSQMNDDAQ